MDGDIGVAEQLGKDVEQCLSSIARKTHLHQIKLETLREQKEDAEREERDLVRRVAELGEAEMAFRREAASIHEQLAARSRQFQELTALASDRLSVRALRMETARLQTLILDLQAEEESLREGLEGGPAVDEAAVAALLAQARAVQSRGQRAAAEHTRVCAEVRSAVALAGALGRGCGRARERVAEDEYCRQLEEAIEDMTLLHVEMELTENDDAGKNVATHGVGVEGADAGGGAPVEGALARLALVRDENDAQFSGLTAALQDRVQRNRLLAEELGLLAADGHSGGAPEERAAAAAAQGRDAEGADAGDRGPGTATGDPGLGHADAAVKVPSPEVTAGVAVAANPQPPQPPAASAYGGVADRVEEIVVDSD